jgi:hypothetical protein
VKCFAAQGDADIWLTSTSSGFPGTKCPHDDLNLPGLPRPWYFRRRCEPRIFVDVVDEIRHGSGLAALAKRASGWTDLSYVLDCCAKVQSSHRVATDR